MIEHKIQARKAGFPTKRELLRLAVAGALVLLVGTTWRQASVGAQAPRHNPDQPAYEQISATPAPLLGNSFKHLL